MKKIILILVVFASIAAKASESTSPTVLRKAKATVLISKAWMEREGDQMANKSEKVCEKEITFDVVEYKLPFNAHPALVSCESLVNGKQVLISVVPQIIEGIGDFSIPLTPTAKRLKSVLGGMQVFAMGVDTRLQPMVFNYFMTEDLSLKSAYLQLMPSNQNSQKITCDEKANCRSENLLDGPEALFSAVVKIEDFQ